MGATSSPDYLIIGNVTRDNTPQGPILGGTSSYAAVTAHKLGAHVGLVTRVGPDIPALDVLDGIEVVEYKSHDYSTTFENIYHDGVRTQKLLALSGPLTLEHVPLSWRESAIVHLAPIAQEFSPSLARHFQNSLIGATIQGWLRGRDAQQTVIYEAHPDLEGELPTIDILVMSLADVFGDRDLLVHFLTMAKIGVETLGPEGCLIYQDGQTTHVPVEPVAEVEPTGAGDIFAAAFFIEYGKTNNLLRAAQFANACASISVGRVGVQGTPSLAEVLQRMEEMYR
jgi:sugar/nucleoside kinase (ribokinase family)